MIDAVYENENETDNDFMEQCLIIDLECKIAASGLFGDLIIRYTEICTIIGLRLNLTSCQTTDSLSK